MSVNACDVYFDHLEYNRYCEMIKEKAPNWFHASDTDRNTTIYSFIDPKTGEERTVEIKKFEKVRQNINLEKSINN